MLKLFNLHRSPSGFTLGEAYRTCKDTGDLSVSAIGVNSQSCVGGGSNTAL